MIKIIQPISELLLDLFPSAKTETGFDKEKLEILIKDYYQYQGNKPTVFFSDQQIEITIHTDKIQNSDNDFRRLTSLCEKGNFKDAKSLVIELIQKDPTNSEYYRIYGQILSDEGNIQEAINQLIDALCWDPNNKWALIMMGNIFARNKDDIQTAIKYYDQAIKVDPQNNIAINNIGATLTEKHKLKEAREYFNKAIKIDPSYPNTYF